MGTTCVGSVRSQVALRSSMHVTTGSHASRFGCLPTGAFCVAIRPIRSLPIMRTASVDAPATSLLDKFCPSPQSTTELAADATTWASQHGLVYGAGLSDPAVALVPAPVALLPVPYPAETFLMAKRAARAFNEMIDAVSCNETFLHQVLASAARGDAFTADLLRILDATADARAARASSGRDIALAINRSDYMLHAPTGSLLQVELNTIASSFGCLATLVSRMHRYLLERAGAAQEDVARLPVNDAMSDISDAIAAAVTAHGAPNGVVVMVVQPGERNAYDQQWIQLALWERHGCRTLRKTLAEIAAHARLNDDGQLTIDGRVASVVYFRAGYTPLDYPTQAEWAARELIERSNAVACPSVALQLAGSKKVQQALAKPGGVEEFAKNPEDAALMRQFFAGLWALDDLETDAAAANAVADALIHPENYVLKPQREGGGNNLYSEALRARLQAGGDLGDLILMQKILPPLQKSVTVRLGRAEEVATLSELGIYGTYLRSGDDVILNCEAGHLVRTKAATSDEGGVAAGFAVLDSPYLMSD